jgi:hypothetical protein
MIDDALLIRLYAVQPLAADKLPYTPEMDEIVKQYNEKHITAPISHCTAYRALLNMRKRGVLVRKTERAI